MITTLFKSLIELVRKDKIILAPYLIFAFLSHFLEMRWPLYTPEMTTVAFYQRYLLGHWLLELIFMGTTLVFALDLLKSNTIHVQEAFKKLGGKLTGLVMVSAVVGIPTAYILQKLLSVSAGQQNLPVEMILGIFVLLCLSVVFMFAPVHVILSEKPALQALKASLLFVRKNPKKVVVFISFIFTINMLSFILSLLTMSFPVLGPSVFFLIFQGLGYGFIHIATVIFYTGTSISTVSVTR